MRESKPLSYKAIKFSLAQLLNCSIAQLLTRPVKAVDIGEQFKFGEKGIKDLFPTVGSLVSTILPNVYILAGLLLFGLLIFGGFGIIMGAGGGDPQKTGQGAKAVTAAIIGFLLIFLSYWIIQIIEVITGLEIFKPTYF